MALLFGGMESGRGHFGEHGGGIIFKWFRRRSLLKEKLID